MGKSTKVGCASTIVVLALGSWCAVMLAPICDCDFSPSLHLEGSTLHVRDGFSAQLTEVPRRQTKDQDFSLKRLESGNYKLSIRFGQSRDSMEGSCISDVTWSPRNSTLFFVRHGVSKVTQPAKYEMWQWNPDSKFKQIASALNRFDNVSLSLDEKLLSASIEPHGNKLLVYSLESGNINTVTCPDSTSRLVILNQNDYLVSTFAHGKPPRVFRWNGESEESELTDRLPAGLIDFVVIDGQTWGLKVDKDYTPVVGPLDRTLARFVEEQPIPTH